MDDNKNAAPNAAAKLSNNSEFTKLQGRFSQNFIIQLFNDMLVGENSHQLSVKILIINPLQLTATMRFMKILRNVDDKVSHLLKFIYNIHIVNTRMVVSVS